MNNFYLEFDKKQDDIFHGTRYLDINHRLSKKNKRVGGGGAFVNITQINNAVSRSPNFKRSHLASVCKLIRNIL